MKSPFGFHLGVELSIFDKGEDARGSRKQDSQKPAFQLHY